MAALALAILASACSKAEPPANGLRYQLNGPLIPARLTMVTAWDYPKNPLTDPSLDDSRLSKDIKWGYQIFTSTPEEASQFAPGRGSCNNCHLNGGQRERSLPLVGVAGMFPEYNRRAGRLISLADRVVDCFLRSQNATGRLATESDHAADGSSQLPSPTSREVLAVSAYITWLSNGSQVGKNPTWRGQNTIQTNALLPIDKLDRSRGESHLHRALHLLPRRRRSGRANRRPRKPDRSGVPTPGMTAPARLVSIRWRGSSGTRCPISIPEVFRTKTRSMSPHSLIRNRVPPIRSRIRTISSKSCQSTASTTRDASRSPAFLCRLPRRGQSQTDNLSTA